MKSCIIGCGNISHKHLEALKNISDVFICGVADLDKSKGEKVAIDYKTKYYLEYKKMIEECKPDVVHICTPHDLHAQMAIYCMEKGCHVIIEKPLALCRKDCEEIIATASKYGKYADVVFQNEYNISIKYLRKLVGQEKFGKLLGATVNLSWRRDQEYYSESDWRGNTERAGGGVIINQSIHSIHLMYKFFGAIKSVKCKTSNLQNYKIDVEDSAQAILNFENGEKVLLNLSICNVINQPAVLEFYFEKVLVIIKGDECYINGKKTNFSDEYIVKCANTKERDVCYGKGHYYWLDNYYNNIRESNYSLNNIREAAECMDIIFALYKSAELDKEVILI